MPTSALLGPPIDSDPEDEAEDFEPGEDEPDVDIEDEEDADEPAAKKQKTDGDDDAEE